MSPRRTFVAQVPRRRRFPGPLVEATALVQREDAARHAIAASVFYVKITDSKKKLIDGVVINEQTTSGCELFAILVEQI